MRSLHVGIATTTPSQTSIGEEQQQQNNNTYENDNNNNQIIITQQLNDQIIIPNNTNNDTYRNRKNFSKDLYEIPSENQKNNLLDKILSSTFDIPSSSAFFKRNEFTNSNLISEDSIKENIQNVKEGKRLVATSKTYILGLVLLNIIMYSTIVFRFPEEKYSKWYAYIVLGIEIVFYIYASSVHPRLSPTGQRILQDVRVLLLVVLIGSLQIYYGPFTPMWVILSYKLATKSIMNYLTLTIAFIHNVLIIMGTTLSLYISYRVHPQNPYQTKSEVDEGKVTTELEIDVITVVFLLQVSLCIVSMVSLSLIQENVRKVTDQQLEIFRQKLMNESKAKFISEMSHELRNPIHGILGAVQLLRHESSKAMKSSYENIEEFNQNLFITNRAALELVNDIYDNSNILLHIFSSSLQLSKLNLGKVKLKIQNVNILHLMESMISVFFTLAVDKGICLQSFFNFENVPLFFQTDYAKLSQILMNLVSNGIKYTSKGHVQLRCDICSDEELEHWRINKKKILEEMEKEENITDNQIQFLKFECIDTGIGMAEENLKEIFKPFSTFDTSSNGNLESTFDKYYLQYGSKYSPKRNISRLLSERNGLGLSISKSLCTAMKGKIFVQSKVGKGTVITVIIPLKQGSPPESQSVQYTDNSLFESCDPYEKSNNILEKITHLKPKKGKIKEIYIIENEESFSETLSSYLRMILGNDIFIYDVREPGQINNNKLMDYAIIIYNEELHEKVKELKLTSKTYLIPIVQRGLSRKYSELSYITKPFRVMDLIDLLERILICVSPIDLGNKLEGISNTSSTENIAFSESGVDNNNNENVKCALVVDDNSVNRKIMQKMLELIGYYHIDVAANGLECFQKYKENKDKYEVILMDLLMPLMDGSEACKEIRNFEKITNRKHCPIIAVTANVWESKESLLDKGFDSVIYKPILIKPLKQEIDRVKEFTKIKSEID
ncbi:hypothetical protein ABK040_016253 [Willaertia magna]